MCTCYMWMSQVVVRVVEPAMERVPEIVMVAIVCQSLNPSQKQVHMRYVSPPIHGEWNETLYARSPDPSALFFARRVWLARLVLLNIYNIYTCRVSCTDQYEPCFTPPINSFAVVFMYLKGMTYIGSETHTMSLYKNYTTAFWDHACSNTNITSYSCYATSYGNYKKLICS